MNELLNFKYNRCIIPFALTSNDVMINATEMAKLFNKRIADWKRLPSAQEYLSALLKVGFSHLDQLIISEWGGSNQGNGRGGLGLKKDVIGFIVFIKEIIGIWK